MLWYTEITFSNIFLINAEYKFSVGNRDIPDFWFLKPAGAAFSRIYVLKYGQSQVRIWEKIVVLT